MFEKFDPMSTDINLTQESLFVITKLNDLMARNTSHPLSTHLITALGSDKFLEITLKAHKISSIINLHKVYDDGPDALSLTSFLQYVYQHKDKFSRANVIQRKMSTANFSKEQAEEFIGDYPGIVDSIRSLADLKKNLQAKYNTSVRSLRTESFAHRLQEASAPGTTVQVLTELADGALGIYDDVREAYHNGKRFSLLSKPFRNRRLEESIEKYFGFYGNFSLK